MFRPQNVAITTAAGGMLPGVVSMAGIVQRREFLGNAVRYAAAVGTHVILVEDEHRRGEPPLDLGVAVQLRVPADQVMLLSG